MSSTDTISAGTPVSDAQLRNALIRRASADAEQQRVETAIADRGGAAHAPDHLIQRFIRACEVGFLAEIAESRVRAQRAVTA